MTYLNSAHLSFLSLHGLTQDQVIDGRFMSKKDIQHEAERQGASFYISSSPCRKHGHTLRTKAGHCAQCDTAKISYQLRSSSAGHVYAAACSAKGWIKFGYTKNPVERIQVLNEHQYASCSSWHLLHSTYLPRHAGRCELEIHARLADRMVQGLGYYKEGKWQACREIFSCTDKEALNIMKDITNKFQ